MKILVAGREISQEQSKQISSSLSQFAGRKVFIASYVGDAEAARLGLQIKAALEGAGIKVADKMGSTYATPNDSGSVMFGIGVSSSQAQQELGRSIVDALRDEAKLKATAHVVQAMVPFKDSEVGIMVGARPVPQIK